MNIIYRFFTLVLLSFFYSCKCNDKVHCPTLSDEAKEWIDFNIGDSVKFVNDQGDHFRYAVASKKISPDYDISTCKGSWPLCSCGGDEKCNETGAVGFSGDSSGMSINIRQGSFKGDVGSFSVTYGIGTFQYTLSPGTAMDVSPYDSIQSSVTLGSHTYQDVFVNAVDTTQTYYQNAKVWKVYYTKTMGVVGFRYRPSQTLFYRE